MKLHKCVRGHWEIWFLADSKLDTKVFRPWVIWAKAKLLCEISWLRVQKRIITIKGGE